MNLDGLTATEIARRVAAREVSAEEVTRSSLERVAERDAGLGAFLHVTADRALDAARRLDTALAAGQPAPPLAGVPLAVKDVLDIEGVPTTEQFALPTMPTNLVGNIAFGGVSDRFDLTELHLQWTVCDFGRRCDFRAARRSSAATTCFLSATIPKWVAMRIAMTPARAGPWIARRCS